MPRGSAAVGEAIALVRKYWLAIPLFAALGAVLGGLLLPGKTSTETFEVSIATRPYSNSQALVDLGIPMPPTLNGPELTNQDVIDRIASTTGIPEDRIEGRIQAVVSPFDPQIINLQVENSGDPSGDRELLEGWYRSVRLVREREVREILDQASSLVESALGDPDTPAPRKRRLKDLSERIELAKATVRPDLTLQRKLHVVTVAEGRSRAVNAGIGLFAGIAFSLLFILALGLFKGRLYTRRGLASSFQSPIVAEASEDGFTRTVDAWAGSAGKSVLLDGTGEGTGSEVAGKITGELPDVTFGGKLGIRATVIPDGTRAVLVLVKAGQTTLSERDWLNLELTQLPDVRVGLLLV